VRSNPLIPLEIDRASFEFSFHHPKTIFYFPSSIADLYNAGSIIFQIRTYCIETVELLFLCDKFTIQTIDVLIGCLPLSSKTVSFYKPFVIILIAFPDLIRIGLNRLQRPLNLRLSDMPLILFVLE